MVVIPKKDGKPRRTVDFQPLNAHATRETHHTMSPFHQARSIPPNTKKTVLDAWNGYHSVPLHDDDRHLTTFITPWGRYRYRVAPQGYIASGDGYIHRYDEIIAEFPQKTKCVDDTLLWEFSTQKSVWQTINYIDLCGRKGITFNIPKFVLAAHEVEFAGFDVTSNSVSPSPILAGNPGLSKTTEHHRHSIMVWTSESSVLCIQYDKQNATIPGTPPAKDCFQMD